MKFTTMTLLAALASTVSPSPQSHPPSDQCCLVSYTELREKTLTSPNIDSCRRSRTTCRRRASHCRLRLNHRPHLQRPSLCRRRRRRDHGRHLVHSRRADQAEPKLRDRHGQPDDRDAVHSRSRETREARPLQARSCNYVLAAP